MRIALEPPPGLTDDDTTFASPGAWATGSNVRFVKGRPESIGPSASAFASLLTGVCRNIKTWTDLAGNINIAFGTHSNLHVFWGNVLYDITPAGLPAGSADSLPATGYGVGTYGTGYYSMPISLAYARTWSLDTFGQSLVACARGTTLYQWNNVPATPAAAVANAPAQITAILVTPERQVLALGCNQEVSGVFNALCIRGCDLENITQWATTATNNAFEHLLEGSGEIVTGRMVGPYVAVWTNVGLYIGQYIGAPGQTYRFDPVAVNCGAIGQNAVYVVGQTAYWIATDKQWRMWSPGTQPQIVQCPIWHDFADNNADLQVAKIHLNELSKFGEIWVHYPDVRDGAGTENSRYFAFNPVDGTWFRGSMARTAFNDAVVAPYPVAADAAGNVYYHENPTGAAVTWSIQSTDTYIEEGEQIAEIQRFIPDFEVQAASLNLTLFVRKDPRSAAVTKGPFTVATTDTRKDFRAAGRVVAVKLDGTGKMRLGKPEFETMTRGMR